MSTTFTCALAAVLFALVSASVPPVLPGVHLQLFDSPQLHNSRRACSRCYKGQEVPTCLRYVLLAHVVSLGKIVNNVSRGAYMQFRDVTFRKLSFSDRQGTKFRCFAAMRQAQESTPPLPSPPQEAVPIDPDAPPTDQGVTLSTNFNYQLGSFVNRDPDRIPATISTTSNIIDSTNENGFPFGAFPKYDFSSRQLVGNDIKYEEIPDKNLVREVSDTKEMSSIVHQRKSLKGIVSCVTMDRYFRREIAKKIRLRMQKTEGFKDVYRVDVKRWAVRVGRHEFCFFLVFRDDYLEKNAKGFNFPASAWADSHYWVNNLSSSWSQWFDNHLHLFCCVLHVVHPRNEYYELLSIDALQILSYRQ